MISEQEFLEFLAEVLMYDSEPMEMDKPLPAAAIDSTGALMLSTGIEDKFGVDLSMEAIGEMSTPRHIYVAISKLL